MEKEYTEQESLQLITEMINAARNDMQNGRGDLVILWGYVIASLALGNFALIQMLGVHNPLIYLIWTLTIPLFIISAIIESRKERRTKVKNRITSIIASLWNGYAITVCVALTMLYAGAAIFRSSEIYALINPLILSLTGLAIFVTGRIFRFKPFVYGGIVFWTGAIVCILGSGYMYIQGFHFIVSAICMIAGFIVPGHLLNRKKE
ncbi:MAG: hypothetical protein LBH04_09430 [Tannerellaceae bacterium]|jgi:hypothetical protein|nr:hypothetical protein [Tannerellaceae bacterium]